MGLYANWARRSTRGWRSLVSESKRDLDLGDRRIERRREKEVEVEGDVEVEAELGVRVELGRGSVC